MNLSMADKFNGILHPTPRSNISVVFIIVPCGEKEAFDKPIIFPLVTVSIASLKYSPVSLAATLTSKNS